MIYFFIIFSAAVLILGFLMLYLWFVQRKRLGILNEENVYQDSEIIPGETIYSKSIPLKGKPDSIILKNNFYIPVEVKTSKTPIKPYENHTMQLMAYCFLVEEKYGIRPPGGYLKYPDKEFHIAYTNEAKEGIKSIVQEILPKKKSNQEIFCQHPQHRK